MLYKILFDVFSNEFATLGLFKIMTSLIEIQPDMPQG